MDKKVAAMAVYFALWVIVLPAVVQSDDGDRPIDKPWYHAYQPNEAHTYEQEERLAEGRRLRDAYHNELKRTDPAKLRYLKNLEREEQSWAETPDAQSSPQDQKTTEKGTRQQIPEGWDWFTTRGTYEANKGLDQAENVAPERAHDEIFEQLQRDLLEKRFDEAMQRRRREQPPAEEESRNPPPKAEPLQPSTPHSIDGLDWVTGKGGSGKGGQPGGSPAGPQFGPPKPGDPMQGNRILNH